METLTERRERQCREWTLRMVEKYQPTTCHSIVICKPSTIWGSIWNMFITLEREGLIKSDRVKDEFYYSITELGLAQPRED